MQHSIPQPETVECKVQACCQGSDWEGRCGGSGLGGCSGWGMDGDGGKGSMGPRGLVSTGGWCQGLVGSNCQQWGARGAVGVVWTARAVEGML